MNAEYDYIIAGAGSAGCTLANRLVNAGKRVLIVEAGPADNTRLIDMPATFAKVIGTARSWIYESEPEPERRRPPAAGAAGPHAGRRLLDQRHALHQGPAAGL